MFDTVNGLPVHVLVVHAVVVGVPVMALLTVAVAARPAWRGRAAWVVALLNAALLATTLVATEAGEELQDRLDDFDPEVARDHAELGELMPWFVAALVVVSLLVPLAGRRRAAGYVVLALAVVVALANAYWVLRVGESGSQSVWLDVIANTDG